MLIIELNDGFKIGDKGIFLKKSDGWTTLLTENAVRVFGEMIQESYSSGFVDGCEAEPVVSSTSECE